MMGLSLPATAWTTARERTRRGSFMTCFVVESTIARKIPRSQQAPPTTVSIWGKSLGLLVTPTTPSTVQYIQDNAKTITYPSASFEMNSAQRTSLRAATVQLVNNMDPNALKHVMYAKNLLNLDEFERIDLPTMTTKDKNMFIIRVLPTKGARAFALFLNCLEETGRENPAHLELRQLLEDGLGD